MTIAISRRWAALSPALLAIGCVRQADIIDEPDALVGPSTPTLEAGPTPVVDSGLGTDAYPACSERPVGGCQGPVDFPCAFPTWVNITAAKCQKLSMCSTNGWLRVSLGTEGCVESIGMDQPNEAAVKCFAAEFGPYRCPCRTSEATYFFGLANTPDSGTCSGPKG